MLAKTLRPSSTATTMVEKLSSANTMSLAPLETSVPVIPIPTPMSAAQSRCVVYAITRHRHHFTTLLLHSRFAPMFWCNSCVNRILVNNGLIELIITHLVQFGPGNHLIITVTFIKIPSRFAMAVAVSRWSPVIIIGRIPASCASTTA